MAYDFTVRERAFEMFCQGRQMVAIAEALGIQRVSTLSEWRRKENWDNRREEIRVKAQAAIDEKITENLTKRLEEHDLMGRAIRGLAAKKLQSLQERARDHAGADGEVIPGIAPEGLELMRVAAAAHRAIQLERQALGLDSEDAPGTAPEGGGEGRAPINLTVVQTDLELIKQLAEVSDSDNGNGGGPGDGGGK